MKEFKSKKTGKISVYSEEEYASMVHKGVIDLKKFIITDIRTRPIIPEIKEVKTKIKKV